MKFLDINGVRKIKEYTDGLINSIKSIIFDNEEVTSAALNDLNTRVNNIEESSSESQSSYNNDQKVVAAALNDLNDRTLDLESSVAPLETTVSSLNTSVSEIEGNLDNMNEPLSFLSDDKARGAFTIYRTVHPFENQLTETASTYNIYANTLTIIGDDSHPISGNKTFTLNTSTYITTAQYDGLTVNHYYWTFNTGSTVPTITWPTGLTWPEGSALTLKPNHHYEISVLNNVVAWMEV